MSIGAKAHELIRVGPLIDVEVRHHPLALADASDELKRHIALWGEPPSAKATLLIDTGAHNTMIDRDILDPMLLERTGHINVETAGGIVSDCPLFRVELRMTLRTGESSLLTSVAGLPAGGLLSKPNARFQGILGRTSLQRMRFVYDGAAGTFDIELAT